MKNVIKSYKSSQRLAAIDKWIKWNVAVWRFPPVLHGNVVRVQAVWGPDADDERAAATSGHQLAGEEARLEGAGEGALQLLDGLLHDALEALLWVLRVDVAHKLGDHLSVGVRLEAAGNKTEEIDCCSNYLTFCFFIGYSRVPLAGQKHLDVLVVSDDAIVDDDEPVGVV